MAGGDAIETTLEGDSLLTSLSEHHLFCVLLVLKADSIARLLCVSSSLRSAVTALLPTVLRFRRQPLHRPLQLVYRSEAALLHESWEGDWRDRWSLGPSAPPPFARAAPAPSCPSIFRQPRFQVGGRCRRSLAPSPVVAAPAA